MDNNIKKYSFFEKWNLYQKERFPLLKNGILILAFSSSAVSFSSLIHGRGVSDFFAYFVAFFTCYLLFLQLRIADEFKDYEEDCKYRNYRPIPQGIIQLKELKYLFIISCGIQFVLALLYDTTLIYILLVVWIYLALMTKEFGAREWLKAHPIIYMVSHMLIMPLVDFYATATEWINYGTPFIGLYWFIILSFFSGINLEIGRKIRSPEDEETGVETYSYLWGVKKAGIVWLGILALTGLFAIGASSQLSQSFLVIVSSFVFIFLSLSIYLFYRFLRNPIKGGGKVFENLSGIFTLIIYLLLGLIPILFKGFA